MVVHNCDAWLWCMQSCQLNCCMYKIRVAWRSRQPEMKQSSCRYGHWQHHTTMALQRRYAATCFIHTQLCCPSTSFTSTSACKSVCIGPLLYSMAYNKQKSGTALVGFFKLSLDVLHPSSFPAAAAPVSYPLHPQMLQEDKDLLEGLKAKYKNSKHLTVCIQFCRLLDG